MALVYADRVQENFTTTGTGDITPSGAVTGFRPWTTLANGDSAAYCAVDPATGAWEVGTVLVSTPPPVDTNFASVAALIHFNGGNGSTTFTNASTISGASTLSSGNATFSLLSTASPKFGTASLSNATQSGGARSGVKLSTSTANLIGTGDFTVEMYFKQSNTSGEVLFDYQSGLFSSNVNGFTLYVGTNLAVYSGGSSFLSGGTLTVDGLWHHVAISRASNVMKLFLDGVQVGSVSNNTNFNQTAGLGLVIGQSANTSVSIAFNGNIDEFRLTVGVGRYASGFTVSTSEFGTASSGGSAVLSRVPTFSSNSNAAVNFAAGTKQIFLTPTAAVFSALPASPTITATGTTGARTINSVAGTVNFAAAATSLVVTNSLVTTSSVILCTVRKNDSTMKSVQVVAAAGSFTLYANAAATAETSVGFFVMN